MAQASCKLGGRFSRCARPVVNTCQYCGAPFCAEHAYYLEGIEAVCGRKFCRAKRDDLVVHLAYCERVRQRNRAGLCGAEDCGPHPTVECSLCQGHFCDEHITQRHYPFREGRLLMERPASVCAPCWDRRKIWARL